MGVTLYHIAALEPPFQEDTVSHLLKSILYKTPKPIPGYVFVNREFALNSACRFYSQKLSDFIMSMLEKKKNWRPLIVDLLAKFPLTFQLTDPVDLENVQFYSSWKESIEKKRNKEGGKSDISDEFAALKNRLQRKVASFSKNLKREKEKNPLNFIDDSNLVSLANGTSDSPPTHAEARSIMKRTVGKLKECMTPNFRGRRFDPNSTS